MHYLDESHILLFLVQVLLLLGLARGLGMFFQRHGQPPITAEILVGILLGPTILGRTLPAVAAALFPDDAVQLSMLDAVAWLGILFFLLTTGLETELSGVWRQKNDAIIIAASDIVVPMAVAFIPSFLIPASYLLDPSQRPMFALFIAAVLAISALPVTARVLQDLDIHRTDVGLLIISALTMNDVAGWVVIALILGFVAHAGPDLSAIAATLGATAAFVAISLTLGRYLVDRAIRWIQKERLPEPGAALTFISLLGLLFGAVTMRIGIQALFGFFIAGLVAGESAALSQRARQTMSQMVRAILVPIFFASIALRIDFFARFNLFLVLFMTLVGVGARFAGAWLGTTLARQSRPNRLLISVAHIPGGEVQIVIGILALNYRLITETVFVAIVIGALVSSIALGPWMSYALRLTRKGSILEFLSRNAVAARIEADNREDVIMLLSRLAAHRDTGRAGDITAAVLEREHVRTTALSEGVAVPHARLASAAHAAVVVGTTMGGVEWDAPDGKPVRMIFLIVTPAERDDLQIMILRSIASAMIRPSSREALLDAETDAELWSAVQKAFTPEAPRLS